MKFASRFLIALGVLMILIAANMNTSVEGASVINFNLLSERNNVVLVGCVMFLAGIILFAASTQNKAGSIQSVVENNEKNGELNLLLTMYNKVAIKVSMILSYLKGHFLYPEDSRSGRTIAGLFVGICLMFPISLIISFGSGLIVIVTLWLAFRPIPASQAISSILTANAIIYFVFTMIGFFILAKETAFTEIDVRHFAGIVPFLITFLTAVLFRYKANRYD